MIRLSINKDFTLPMLGKDVFVRLMRSGVEYDKVSRRFRIKEGADVASILAILKEAVREEISIELPCMICGNDAGCSECEFSSNCDRTSVASRCICKQCIKGGYYGYIEHLIPLFNAVKSEGGEVKQERRRKGGRER
ncbi:MAG: hypothetical protein QW450_04645 [Candidatus Nitrosocaldus sp.]